MKTYASSATEVGDLVIAMLDDATYYHTVTAADLASPDRELPEVPGPEWTTVTPYVTVPQIERAVRRVAATMDFPINVGGDER